MIENCAECSRIMTNCYTLIFSEKAKKRGVFCSKCAKRYRKKLEKEKKMKQKNEERKEKDMVKTERGRLSCNNSLTQKSSPSPQKNKGIDELRNDIVWLMCYGSADMDNLNEDEQCDEINKNLWTMKQYDKAFKSKILQMIDDEFVDKIKNGGIVGELKEALLEMFSDLKDKIKKMKDYDEQ
jgi:hypothetical protein